MTRPDRGTSNQPSSHPCRDHGSRQDLPQPDRRNLVCGKHIGRARTGDPAADRAADDCVHGSHTATVGGGDHGSRLQPDAVIK